MHNVNQENLDSVRTYLYKDSISEVKDSISVSLTDSLTQQRVDNTESVMEKVSKISRYYGEPLPSSLAQSDSVFVFFFLCFMIFARIFKGNLGFLKENMLVVLFLRQKHEDSYERTSREIGLSIFLLIQAVVLISFCIYDSFIEYIPPVYDNSPLITILSFIVLILLFFAFKFLFYKLFGYIFDLKNIGQVLTQTNLRIFETLGIIFFFPVLLLIYLEYWHIYVIGIMLVLFVLSLTMFFVQIIRYFVKEKFNFLFLIAYLCSVEIIPYLFLGVGLMYLYKTDLFSVILWH